MVIEAANAKIGTFMIATAVGIADEAAIPPVANVVKNEMVDNTVAEGGGENLANDGLLSDKGDAAARMIMLGEDVAAELVDILDEVSFEFKLVAGFEFVFAGFVKGGMELETELVVEGVKFKVIGLGGTVEELVEDPESLIIFCVFC